MATVLVVDDESAIRDLIRMNLEVAGHDVVTASDGGEALAAVQDHPDVMILDVMMPDMEGWDVLAQMKSPGTDTVVSRIPVIMLTARQDDMDRIRGSIEGAIRYLTKPFSAKELRAAVARALEGDPEPVERRRVQTLALENLARLEQGRPAVSDRSATGPRPHLTRLGRAPLAPVPTAKVAIAPSRMASLSTKQRELLDMVATTSSVREAAEQLGVSRSNVYASLRRISSKLDAGSVPELLSVARAGELPDDAG